MRHLLMVAMSAGLVLAEGCSTTEWVHPNKPKEAFTEDYNACERRFVNDPKLQQGLRLAQLDATERCIREEGWVLKRRR
jgi:hypothetical protein